MARPVAVHTVETLLARTVDDAGCLIWQGYSLNGTPMVHHRDRMVSVRWLLHHLAGGKIAQGVGYWRTTCECRGCVNPEHSLHVTDKQHMQAMARAGLSPAVAAIKAAKISKARRKLTDEQVREILDSPDSCKAVADRLGCSKTIVARYRRGDQGMARNPFAGLIR